jgi:hypothetical protein
MTKIISLEVIFQSRVSPRARKNVVRRDAVEGPYRNRKVTMDLPEALDMGPGSGANIAVRRLVAEELRKHKPDENLFYVVAGFEHYEHGRVSRYFKTIAHRQEITL